MVGADGASRAFIYNTTATPPSASEGGQGPQGPQGPQGEAGPRGLPGRNGTDGARGPQGVCTCNDLSNQEQLLYFIICVSFLFLMNLATIIYLCCKRRHEKKNDNEFGCTKSQLLLA